jgi:hypothetical protein
VGRSLLSYRQAGQKARAALDSGVPEVVFPLAFENREVKVYRAIKPAAFLFRTPEQRRTILRQIEKFQDATGCGLEVLALQRSRRGKRQRGSIRDVAEGLFRLINGGHSDVNKALNLGRWRRANAEMIEERLAEIARRREASRASLVERIDLRNYGDEHVPTGLILTDDDRGWIEPID